MVRQAGLGAPGLLVDRPGPLRGLQEAQAPGPGLTSSCSPLSISIGSILAAPLGSLRPLG